MFNPKGRVERGGKTVRRQNALQPDARDVSGGHCLRRATRAARQRSAPCRSSPNSKARPAGRMPVAWATSASTAIWTRHHHPHGAAQGRQSLRASRRRLGERLRTRSGISGNGEQEQSHAQSCGAGRDVWENDVAAEVTRLKLESRETPKRRQSFGSTGKLTDYLLNAAHPDNNGKAEFFEAFGFRLDDGETLAKAFRRAAMEGEVIQHLETSHGEKYVLHAAMETPSGKTPLVRTVWIVDRGRNIPRLVTAYPA